MPHSSAATDPAEPHRAALWHRLQEARSICVLTGAGISAESGIPTFRDALTGLWAHDDPARLASPDAFARDPALVTRWYDERRLACGHCAPNPGHRALAQLERACRARGAAFTLVTQNVDRLHQQAGSEAVVELHGSLWEWRCTACGAAQEEHGPAFPEHPPRCQCGGARRPAVVWFGERLPEDALTRAMQAAASCELFLNLGTSGMVEPAASLVRIAAAAGAYAVEINPDKTPVTALVDLSLRARTGDLLPRLVDGLVDAGSRGSM